MSPAPVRASARPGESFPHIWGYWAGALVILVGVIIGGVMIVTSITGFVDDVREFRRAAQTGSLETTLERGAELFVYNEDGFDAGPFDVKVTRTSDDVEIATTRVANGATYDVDGNEGRARVAFKVPTSDIYRVEVDTSLGEIAAFAVGGDVGNSRTSGIVRGVIVGSILALVGFMGIIWTSMLHARWRLRGAVLDQVASARSATARASEAVSAQAQSARVADTADQTTAWARSQVGRARERLDEAAGPDVSEWRRNLATQARDRLDQVDDALGTAEAGVADAAATTDLPDDIASRVDEALGRMQDRIESGDRLRDIAADERVAARTTADELAAQATEAVGQTTGALGGAVDRVQGQVAGATAAALGEVEGLTTDLTDIANTTLDDMATQASVAGDDLAAGLIASTGAAVGAAAAATAERGHDVLGFPTGDVESDRVSPLPTPPQSSLPAPPDLPAPPLLPDPPTHDVVVPEPPASLAPEAPRPAPDVTAAPAPAAELRLPEVAEPVVARAVGDAPGISPPPAAARPLRTQARTTAPTEAVADATAAPASAAPMGRTTGDSFSALAPPPTTTRVETSLEADPDPVADGDDPEVAVPTEPDGASFTLAPPPDYSTVQR